MVWEPDLDLDIVGQNNKVVPAADDTHKPDYWDKVWRLVTEVQICE